MLKRTSFVVLVATLSLAAAAPARADRRNPLEGQPSIRHRLELRNLRFEATPFVGFTLLQDFNNTFYGGVKLEYHLSDWVSIGGAFAGGAAIGTGLKTTLLDTLKDQPSMGGPARADAEAAMNHIAWWAAGQAMFTPFGGKFALFSKSFFNYDFYVGGGVGFVGLTNNLDTARTPSNCGSNAMMNEFGCNTGLKVGPTVAAGIHMFFNEWLAFDLSYRTIIIKDNPAGRDTNGDRSVNDDDLGWSYKQFVSLGLAFYLPTKAAISR